MYQTGAKLARLSRVSGMDEEEDGYGLNYDQGPASYYTEEQRNASSKRYDEAIKTLRDIRINSTIASRMSEDVANPQPKIAQIGWGKELKDVKLPGANLPASERLAAVELTETEKRAQQLQNIAKDFAATDPKLSNDYFKQSLEMRDKAAKEKADFVDLQNKKLEQRAELAASVVDQDSLDAAVAGLKALGTPVPKEMTVFNEKSQEYFKSRALMSSSYRQQQELELRADAEKRLKEKQEADEKARQQEIKIKESRLQIQRDGLAARITKGKDSMSKAKEPSKFSVGAEMQYLEEFSDKFAELDDALKPSLASDVNSLAYQYMQERQMTLIEARQLARKQILDNINEKGEYLLQTAPKANVKPGSMPDADAKAKLGAKYKPGYRYWIENGRIKGEPI